jgi:dCTP diphosphatase
MSGLGKLQQELEGFYESRNWRQFQTPKDLAASLAIEAAEIQELFLWQDSVAQQRTLDDRRRELAHELADVLINCLNLAHLGAIDLDRAVREKLALLDEKYPPAAVCGKVMPHR